ncbi:hypothetical protein J6590_074152 [Homalodisca vitripennis]|nr:hypothetical protein J6590_074152 [Homalodisca vitripennis]
MGRVIPHLKELTSFGMSWSRVSRSLVNSNRTASFGKQCPPRYPPNSRLRLKRRKVYLKTSLQHVLQLRKSWQACEVVVDTDFTVVGETDPEAYKKKNAEEPAEADTDTWAKVKIKLAKGTRRDRRNKKKSTNEALGRSFNHTTGGTDLQSILGANVTVHVLEPISTLKMKDLDKFTTTAEVDNGVKSVLGDAIEVKTFASKTNSRRQKIGIPTQGARDVAKLVVKGFIKIGCRSCYKCGGQDHKARTCTAAESCILCSECGLKGGHSVKTFRWA